jgi:uncharacterized protein involved in exopolysaccharide biosynthesis/Mrp family chromosome partitioning ATPase
MQAPHSIVPVQSTALQPVEAARMTTALQAYTPPPHHYAPQPSSPAAAPQDVTVISLADIIGYIRRFWKLGVILALPLAAAAFYVLGFGPKVYEAESKLEVQIQENTLLKLDPQNGSLSELSAPQIINNHRTGLKTRRFMDYLYKRLPRAEMEAYIQGSGELGLKSRLMIALGVQGPPKAMPPEEIFAVKIDKAVRVEPVKESHILRIIVRDGNPLVAASLANHYVEDYIGYVEDDGVESATYAFEQLTVKVADAKERLDKAEAEMSAFNQKADLLKSNTGNDLSTMRAENFEKARAEVEVELLRSQERVRQLRTAFDQGLDVAGIKGLGDDSQIVEIQKKLNEAKSRRDSLLEWCGPNHPKLMQASAEIVRLQEENRLRIEAIVQAAESDEKRLQSEQEQFTRMLSSARGEAFDQSPNRIRQKQLNDQVESLRSLYAELGKHMDRARLVSELRGTANLGVKDIAVPPEGPVSPKKSIALLASMMLFGLVSFGVPIGLGLFQDHVKPLLSGVVHPPQTPSYTAPQASPFHSAPAPTISHVDLPRFQAPMQNHNAQSSSTQVLASIPELMAGEGPVQLSELLHPAPLTGGNAVVQITNLLEKQRFQRRGTGVLLITSANPSEGKSLLASALAASLCTVGRTVFLAECNPAAPSIQNWFPQAESYSSWTNDLETLRYGQSNLFLLPAHDLPSYEMSDLVDGYRAWIGRAKDQGMDWVILDGASLLRGFADVAQLAPMATDILFVHDSTRCDADQVKAALNLLRPLAVNDAMRGMVLNRQTMCAV